MALVLWVCVWCFALVIHLRPRRRGGAGPRVEEAMHRSIRWLDRCIKVRVHHVALCESVSVQVASWPCQG